MAQRAQLIEQLLDAHIDPFVSEVQRAERYDVELGALKLADRDPQVPPSILAGAPLVLGNHP